MCGENNASLSKNDKIDDTDINEIHYCEEWHGDFEVLKVHNKNLIDIAIL